MPEEDHGLFPKEGAPSGGKGKGLNAKGPGGIPVWGYGVALGAIVVGYFYLKSGSSTSAASAAQQGSGTGQGTPGAGQYGTEQVSVSGGGGSWYPPWRGWIGGGPGGFTGFQPAPSTNEQWGQLVTDWLISKAENPGDVSETVNDYLDGQRLDTEERGMIDLAINIWGAPPQTPVPVTGDGGGRKRHHPKQPDPDPNPGGPRKRPTRDRRPDPGGPASHTREQTINDGGTVAGTGKTVVIVE